MAVPLAASGGKTGKENTHNQLAFDPTFVYHKGHHQTKHKTNM